MEKIWERFPDLVNAVRRDHEKQGQVSRSHHLLHAVMVGQYGPMIAKEERTGILAGIGGLIHNTDRLYPTDQVRRIIQARLSLVDIKSSEKDLVYIAVMNHDKMNDDTDNDVTITLKDADRLANLSPATLMGCGQFRPNIPLYDPKFIETTDPTATYTKPKTVFHDAFHSRMQWKVMLRLPKAKVLAERYFAFRMEFMKLIKGQLEEVDMYDHLDEIMQC